jgi:hypothetical protein
MPKASSDCCTLAAWPRTDFECDVGYVLADATAPGVSKKEITTLAVGKIHQDWDAAEAMKQIAGSSRDQK